MQNYFEQYYNLYKTSSAAFFGRFVPMNRLDPGNMHPISPDTSDPGDLLTIEKFNNALDDIYGSMLWVRLNRYKENAYNDVIMESVLLGYARYVRDVYKDLCDAFDEMKLPSAYGSLKKIVFQLLGKKLAEDVQDNVLVAKNVTLAYNKSLPQFQVLLSEYQNTGTLGHILNNNRRFV